MSLTPDVCTIDETDPSIVDGHRLGRCIVRATGPGDLVAAPAFVERRIEIGTNPPALEIAEPAEWARIAPGAAVTVRAVVRDPRPGLGLQQVEYFVDGMRFAVVTSAPYGAVWQAGASGLHQLTARATYLTYVDGIAMQVVTEALPATVVVTPTPDSFVVRLDSPQSGMRTFSPATLQLSASVTGSAARLPRWSSSRAIC